MVKQIFSFIERFIYEGKSLLKWIINFKIKNKFLFFEICSRNFFKQNR